MSKDDRSAINPFTGKKHLDLVNDDQFLNECYNQYYSMVNQCQLLDNTSEGQLVNHVASKLIGTVGSYLKQIGRFDYVEDYYDWEVHLVSSEVANAFCMPGGKIVIYSGILSIANTEESLAFIMGHEMAHALLDHSRTQTSERQRKNSITGIARLGGIGLSLFGFRELAELTFAATNVAELSSEYLLLQPHGRDQELEADKLGITLIHLAGYNIQSIPDFWRKMSSQNSNEFDFFSTHPADSKRINAMGEMINIIQNQTDFYSAPILSDEFKSTATITENSNNPQINQTEYSNNNTRNTNPNQSTKTYFNRKICLNCGKIVESSNNFCTDCGNQLTIDTKCNNCGENVSPEDKFCSNCGCKFSN